MENRASGGKRGGSRGGQAGDKVRENKVGIRKRQVRDKQQAEDIT